MVAQQNQRFTAKAVAVDVFTTSASVFRTLHMVLPKCKSILHRTQNPSSTIFHRRVPLRNSVYGNLCILLFASVNAECVFVESNGPIFCTLLCLSPAMGTFCGNETHNYRITWPSDALLTGHRFGYPEFS